MHNGARAGSIRSHAPYGPLVARRPLEQTRTQRRHQEEQSTRPHLLNAEVFKGVLVRERKRADRSNQPFVLLLVSANDRGGPNSSSMWRAATEALTAAIRETDVLGWFEQRSVIGVVLTEIQALDAPVAREIEARVRLELAKRLNSQAPYGFSIRFHVYPEPRNVEAEALLSVDPILRKFHSPEEQAPIRDAIKRGLDLVGSLTLLAALSPLFLLIAALVKLTSRGPIFFKQGRVGQMAKTFTMLKFRTMHVNAGHALHQEFVTSFIKSGSQAQEPGSKGLFKIANDPRVTPIGRILRKTSLDELPQLWNVVQGTMSLVGPRPPIPYEVEQYEPWHCRRILEAKPGITGLWQVAGRSRTTFDEMVRLDLRYARTCSLWTDLKILLATPMAVIAGKGAC
jgi:lipopolysaccharide/colanic/teichoic acid biosynthesis glycosyltransferase